MVLIYNVIALKIIPMVLYVTSVTNVHSNVHSCVPIL